MYQVKFTTAYKIFLNNKSFSDSKKIALQEFGACLYIFFDNEKMKNSKNK